MGLVRSINAPKAGRTEKHRLRLLNAISSGRMERNPRGSRRTSRISAMRTYGITASADSQFHTPWTTT